MNREVALRAAAFGWGTAENDPLLAETFIETDTWSSVVSGKTDIVLGAKGSGKSAIYRGLFSNADRLRDNGIVLIAAENVESDPVFSDVTDLAKLSARQLVALWRIYILTLVAEKARRMRIRDAAAGRAIDTIQRVGLLPPPDRSTLLDVFKSVLSYVQFEVSAEGGVPGAAAIGVRVTLHEPSKEEEQGGAISVHRLQLILGEALRRKGLTAWVLVDRLDAAFPAASNEQLESNVLRALIQTYISLLGRDYRVSLKLFLRDDVWDRILRFPGEPIVGFEALRTRFIRWNDEALVALMARRLVKNSGVRRLYHVSRRTLLKQFALQQELVLRAFPTAQTSHATTSRVWMFDLLRDGDGRLGPRELIQLMSHSQEAQLNMMSLRIAGNGTELFELAAVLEAIREVSDRRLQTLNLENPNLAVATGALHGVAEKLTLTDLTRLWRNLNLDPAATAARLTSLGLFAHDGQSEIFQIAPLYRPTLSTLDWRPR